MLSKEDGYVHSIPRSVPWYGLRAGGIGHGGHGCQGRSQPAGPVTARGTFAPAVNKYLTAWSTLDRHGGSRRGGRSPPFCVDSLVKLGPATAARASHGRPRRGDVRPRCQQQFFDRWVKLGPASRGDVHPHSPLTVWSNTGRLQEASGASAPMKACNSLPGRVTVGQGGHSLLRPAQEGGRSPPKSITSL